MKVKFFSDYASSENLLKRFKANYIIYDNELQFTTGEDYNLAVVFNRSNEPIKSDVKIITVLQEPSWSPTHELTTFLTNSDYLIVHDAELFERSYEIRLGGKVIESPAYMFYHDEVDHSFFDGAEHLKKSKKISIIVSGLYSIYGNYNKRLDLVRKILMSDLDIDIYGRRLNLSDPRYKGSPDFKFKGLLPYEYSIAIENSNEKNYITEKFVDCLLCNTVPIYNGAPNIGDVYDNRYFRTIDLDSPSVIDDIKDIISVPSTGTLVNKEIYIKQYNLYTKLKEIVSDIKGNEI